MLELAKVLVIDDDAALLRALRLGLRSGGHEVTSAPSGEQGLTQAAMTAPDVVVLDLGLPDMDGLEVLRRIRQWSDVPIVVLSATDEERRKVAAFDIGADDYVTKPFGMAELEARIRAALRRRESRADSSEAAVLRAGPLELHPENRQVFCDGKTVHLTSKEFDLLAYLTRHAGKTCTHEMLLSAVWGPGYAKEAQYLHAYVHRLRDKLSDHCGDLINTAPGIGYSLTP